MSLEDEIALLSRAPLVGLLDTDALRLLAFAAEKRRLRTGDVLFNKGERADAGFVVAEGAIALDTGTGRPAFVAGPGALIGQTALFVRGTRAATATATEPASVLRLSVSLLRRVLEEYPAAAAAMHEAIAGDLAALTLDLGRAGRLFEDESAPAAR